MSVNTKSRKPLLCMGSQHACQIHRTGTLCSVKSPYPLDGFGIHIHGLRTIAPAGCYRQSNIHTGLTEFIRTCRSLTHPSDGGIRDNNLYRITVGITKVFLKQLRRRLRHIHGLLFQRLPHLKIASSSVNRRSDADHRKIPHISVLCHFLSLLVKIPLPVSL